MSFIINNSDAEAVAGAFIEGKSLDPSLSAWRTDGESISIPEAYVICVIRKDDRIFFTPSKQASIAIKVINEVLRQKGLMSRLSIKDGRCMYMGVEIDPMAWYDTETGEKKIL